MAVRVVTDDQRRFLWRRMGRLLESSTGAVLVGLGIGLTAASLFMLTGTTGTGSLRGTHLPLVAAGWMGLPVAIALWVVGFRLARRRRRLVLFLRRFGHTGATRAASYATRSIGGSWRLVTLDDAHVVPIGVEGAAGRAVVASSIAERLGRWASDKGMPYASLLLAFALAGVGLVFGISYLRNPRGDLGSDVLGLFEQRGPLTWLLYGSIALFALYGIVILVVGGLMFMVSAAMVLAAPITGIAEEAEKNKTRTIKDAPEVVGIAKDIADKARHFFSPRLVVLSVAGDVWRSAVLALADPAAAAIVDISEPTAQVLWEIEALQRCHKPLAYVVDAQRLALLSLPAVTNPESYGQRLRVLADGQTVISYTTDRRGLRRFARTLRAHLEDAVAQP